MRACHARSGVAQKNGVPKLKSRWLETVSVEMMPGARALHGGPSSLPLSRAQLFYLFTTMRVRVPPRTTLRALTRTITQGKKAFAPIKISKIWA